MARQGDGAQLSENGPLELPLIDLPSAHPCYGCAACCRYVAVEFDPPTVPRDYDQIHWYLTHRDVSVYIDWEGDWYVEFKTLCEHLTARPTGTGPTSAPTSPWTSARRQRRSPPTVRSSGLSPSSSSGSSESARDRSSAT
jgi:hypothetical protein